ncbi:MAG: glycosyltransferase [Candidatus Omnitrophica bacterium]|nr:glycosyltransferase [Candidatus Omnitrophota bacterium]
MRKIVRIITRLNVGGPAHQAIGLSQRRPPLNWDTLLVAGLHSPSEGSMEYLLKERPIRFLSIPSLRRELNPFGDLLAWIEILRCLFKERPQILHTHTAKAGALGRTAGLGYRWLTGDPLKIVHTFHGHVLEGYFPRWTNWIFQAIERGLSLATDRLVAVSPAIREELIRLKVARPGKIEVVPLGLPLEGLLELPQTAPASPVRIGLVGRLTAIKNHRLLLEALARLKGNLPRGSFRCVLIGDGELKGKLIARARALKIDGEVEFAGWKTRMPEVYRSLQIVCLTSNNEGTPVSLIEAMASARPVIATSVGGVPDLLREGPSSNGSKGPAQGSFEKTSRGILVRPGDVDGLSLGLEHLIKHPEECLAMGAQGRRFAEERFSLKNLARRLDELYGGLLES